MDELEQLVRSTLHDRAGATPEPVALLARVSARSVRLRRRRRLARAVPTALSVVCLAVLARPLLTGPDPGVVRPELPAGSSTAAPERAPIRPSSPTASGPALPAPARTTSLPALLPGDLATPALPLRLGRDAADRMGSPEVSLRQGAVVAAYPARDPVGDADITLTATTGQPRFDPPAARLTLTTVRVRGHQATLRTVALRPAAELTLVWQESPNSWLQLRTDDTYTPDQVAAFADALQAQPLAVSVPFRFSAHPAGYTAWTVDADQAQLHPGPGASGVAVTVRRFQGSAPQARPVRVGGLNGYLSSAAGSTTLAVDLPDLGSWLQVEVEATGPPATTFLVQFAAGIQPVG